MSEAMDGDALLLLQVTSAFCGNPCVCSLFMLSRPDWIFSMLDIQFELATQIQAVANNCLTPERGVQKPIRLKLCSVNKAEGDIFIMLHLCEDRMNATDLSDTCQVPQCRLLCPAPDRRTNTGVCTHCVEKDTVIQKVVTLRHLSNDQKVLTLRHLSKEKEIEMQMH